MLFRPAKFRIALVFLFATALGSAHGQIPQVLPPTSSAKAAQVQMPPNKPLPDIIALMRDVEANQSKAEAIEKDYIYHSITTQQENDSHGKAKKTTVTESDHFWINGVPVQRITKKDGRTLTPGELAKEDARIDKLAEKANERRDKADSEGKETDPRGEEEVSVSRLIELGSFTNPRRVQFDGRDTIAVDFTGNPKAKAQNRAEDVIRDLSGTAWIDEQDHVLARVEGRFTNSFKIAGGLIADVDAGTSFSMAQAKVNDEVWLPVRFEGRGSFRALLFWGFNGSAEIENSDFRKFRTRSTILPTVRPIEPSTPVPTSTHP